MQELISNINNQIEVRQSLISMKSLLTDDISLLDSCDKTALIELLMGCIQDSDAKVRKNAVLILGLVDPNGISSTLWDFYQNESTLMIKDAYLQSILKADSLDSDILSQLTTRLEQLTSNPVSEEDKKHINSEIKAIEKILNKHIQRPKREFLGWDAKWDVILDYPAGSHIPESGLKAMLKEVKSADRNALVKKHPYGLLVRTSDIRKLLDVRQYRQLYFDIRMPENESDSANSPATFATDLAESNLLGLLAKMFKLKDDEAIYFKLKMITSLVGGDKSRLTKLLSDSLEAASNRKLISDTKNYDIEIEFFENQGSFSSPKIICSCLDDSRFSYRKNAISTSTHPSLAALVMTLCSDYMITDATILDCFCGVGSFIIERDKYAPSKDRYALDIFQEAIKGAKENSNLAHMHANFITRDIKDFTSKHSFDEIFADFPSRGKRDKAELSTLYDTFFSKADKLLSPGGYIFAVSEEKGAVMKNIRLHPSLKLVKEYKLSEKTDYCLFICSKSSNVSHITN